MFKYRVTNFITLLIAHCSLLIALGSCDKVEPPYINKTANTTKDSSVQRTVLLEEITGDQCGNCPAAHAQLEKLQKEFGSNLVSYAINPSAAIGLNDNKLSSQTSNDIYNKWLKSTPFPTGMINRKVFPPPINGRTIDYDDWEGTVKAVLAAPRQLDIQLFNNYDIASNNLTTYVYIHTLDTISLPLMLSVYIIEDSIRSLQLVGSKEVPDYLERNVLRGSMNETTWGEDLKNKALQKDQFINRNYKYTLNTNWIYQQVYTVAFVYNNNSKEVIQCQKAKITP